MIKLKILNGFLAKYQNERSVKPLTSNNKPKSHEK